MARPSLLWDVRGGQGLNSIPLIIERDDTDSNIMMEMNRYFPRLFHSTGV